MSTTTQIQAVTMLKPLLVLAVVAFIVFTSPTKTQGCDDNEVYSNCTNGGCGPQTCDGLGQKIGCVKMDQANCKEGYVCKEGYLRDENNKCIPKTECPECGGDPNAISGCGVNCGKHCSDINNDRPKPCIRICYVDACDCRDGYYYDDNTGLCVLPEDCTPVCGENEVFSSCVNGGCDAKNCSQVGQPVPCVKPEQCCPGCLCKEGWLRADNGTCVPVDQCPNSCNKPHEYYDDCVKSCDPQTCDSIGQVYNCPIQTTVCKGGCRCEDGYYRNENGKCIPKSCCTTCGGDPNAKPGCGINCGRLCSNYMEENVSCILLCKDGCDCKKDYVYDENIQKCVRPENCTASCGANEIYSTCANGGCRKRYCSEPTICIDPFICEGGCICQDGYTRDEDDNCVPEDECPGQPQCPDGERYEESPDQICEPRTCEQLGFPLNCTTSSDDNCQSEPACVCDNGYVRDDDGNCIPKDQCPSCGGDPNAVSGCSNYCGNTCSDYNNIRAFMLCPDYCVENGCACRKGFVYDGNINKCVLPKQCSQSEVQEDCGSDPPSK